MCKSFGRPIQVRLQTVAVVLTVEQKLKANAGFQTVPQYLGYGGDRIGSRWKARNETWELDRFNFFRTNSTD